MNIYNKFWDWYARNETLNIGIAAFLFIFQLIHLFWLTFDVVWERLFLEPLIRVEGYLEIFIALSDYLEIPAIFSVVLFYVYSLKKGRNIFKNTLMLIFINLQWLHILWITDEIIVQEFSGMTFLALSPILVWGAILIDYLELPVIYDTIKEFFSRVKKRKVAR